MFVLVDIDGTLAIRTSREPFEWSLLHTDKVNSPVVEVVRALKISGHDIVFVTGRHEELRRATELWLLQHVAIPGELIMRPQSDSRPDDVIKEELIRARFQDFSEILLVIDDRKRVVDMWRQRLGLTCLQVADGEF